MHILDGLSSTGPIPTPQGFMRTFQAISITAGTLPTIEVGLQAKKFFKIFGYAQCSSHTSSEVCNGAAPFFQTPDKQIADIPILSSSHPQIHIQKAILSPFAHKPLSSPANPNLHIPTPATEHTTPTSHKPLKQTHRPSIPPPSPNLPPSPIPPSQYLSFTTPPSSQDPYI